MRTKGKKRKDTRKPAELPRDGSLTVSSVRVSSADPTKANIRVAGVLMGRLDTARVRELGIETDTPWDEALYDQIGAALEDDLALRAAVRLMSVRDRSASELARALMQRKHPKRAIDIAVEKLKDLGYQDDERYAHNKARSVARMKPSGARYIENKLREKGINQDQARRAAAEALEGVDPLESATALAMKWSATLPMSLDAEGRKRRLIGRLARRGFDHDVVRRAVEAAERDQGSEH